MCGWEGVKVLPAGHVSKTGVFWIYWNVLPAQADRSFSRRSTFWLAMVQCGIALALLLSIWRRSSPARDLPEELRAEFLGIIDELVKRRIDYPHRASRINLRRPQSGKIAERIFSMYVGLHGGI
jgi:hypothetical protein